MATALNDNLPEALKSLRTRPLFVMRLDVRKLLIVGAAPGAFRRVGVVRGGLFEGERLSGEVLEGGSDWQTVRSDGATSLNVRLVLKTNDDALIGMTYQGVRHGPPEVIARIEKGEVVDPASYYFRITPVLRPPPRNTTGSTVSSRSGSATGSPMGRFTASSKFCEPLLHERELEGAQQGIIA
jgi:hypothetical protein